MKLMYDVIEKILTVRAPTGWDELQKAIGNLDSEYKNVRDTTQQASELVPTNPDLDAAARERVLTSLKETISLCDDAIMVTNLLSLGARLAQREGSKIFAPDFKALWGRGMLVEKFTAYARAINAAQPTAGESQTLDNRERLLTATENIFAHTRVLLPVIYGGNPLQAMHKARQIAKLVTERVEPLPEKFDKKIFNALVLPVAKS